MCPRELPAERDDSVAVVGCHGWWPFVSTPPCLARPATGTRCCRYLITCRTGAANSPALTSCRS
jgi:hypothetical protein